MELEKQTQPLNVNIKKTTSGDVPSPSLSHRSVVHNSMPKPIHTEKSEQENSSEKNEQKLMIRVLDKLIGFSIFMLFFGLPIFFTGLTQQGIIFDKQIYFYIWTLLILICWVGKGVLYGEMRIRRTALDIPIVIFWAVYLLVTIVSVDRWHSFVGIFGDPSRGFMNVTALVLIYYVLMSNFTEKMFHWIVRAIISSATVVFIWSTLGILGINFLPEKMIAYAPLSLLGSVSGLGMFLGIMLPIIITVIFKLRDNEKMSRWMKNIFTTILFVDLILDIVLLLAVYSFVPWIGFMIGIGFFLIFILSRIVRPIESWAWVPIATFMLLMIILMSGSSFNVARVNLPVEVSPAYSMSWQIAKDSIKDNFFLGSGAASYGYDFSLHRPYEFNLNQLYNLRFYQGTGAIFEALSTIGALGTLALALVILSFISVVIYLLVARKEKNKIYSLGFVTASLIFLLSGMLARMEGSILILGILLSIVALSIVTRESEAEERFLNLSIKASPKYALTLAFIFMVVSAGVAYLFVFVGKVYVADVYAGSALRQTEVLENSSVAKMVRAANLNTKESKYYTSVGQQYMILANNEMLKGEADRNINKLQQYLNNSIMAATQGRDLAPNDVSTVEVLAQIYENAGAYVPDSLKLAEDTYKRALELEPNNPNFTLELGKVKISQATNAKTDDEKKQLIGQAKDLFQKSTDEKNNFAPGYYQLAITQAALGDVNSAIDSMQKAVQLDNSNIDYFFNLAKLYQQRGTGDDNKNAEAIFKQILGVNDKEINTHFSLAMLYEKMNENDKAISEYTRVMELLPADNKDVIDKIKTMISNVKNGVSNLNTPAPASAQAPAAPTVTPATPTVSPENPAPNVAP